MYRCFTRACVAVAVGVALSTMGVAGASASGAVPRTQQAMRVSPARTSLAAASPGAQLWAKPYNGTGNNADVATSVAVSPTSGTVYVTGWSSGTGEPVVDYATVAYDAATGARRWVARYNGATGSNNVPTSVAVSPDGKRVFVTGKSTLGQNGDYATVAYDATGTQLWVERYNGPLNSDDGATAVAVSPTSGTVYVTGFSFGKVGGADYATVAYDAATGHQLWVKRYNGPGNGNDNANSMAVNPTSGTVYVTGQSWSGASGNDYATVAYNANGSQQWVKRYVGPGNNTDDATSVAVNPTSGTVYVTGASWGGASAFDYATITYSAAGTQQWVKRYNGPGNNSDQATSVAVNPTSGTVYVTGQSAGTSTGADYATIAYTAATGHQQWVARYNDPGNGTDIATSMAVNPASGTVYVTGQSQPGEEYATVAYNATGTQQWAQRHNGSEAYSSSVAVSPTTGTVFVTGMTHQDYITIAYSG
jgi:DNA-binding beta-propeller fold protein YncE